MEALGGFLVLFSLVLLVVGGRGLWKGEVEWARLPTRAASGAALAGGVVMFAVGGALVPTEETANRGTTTTTTTTTRPAETTQTTTTLPSGLPPGDDTTVSRVVDGDTIEVASGPPAVRLIGIDAPETNGGCFAAEATAHLVALLPTGMRVRLAYDAGHQDRFGRTLAYVYRLTDGLFVNLTLARDGFAVQLTVPPNVAHAEEFRAAVTEARTGRRGLWAACQTTTTTTTRVTTTTTMRLTTTTGGAGGCHASYSGACIPANASDVDCAGGSGNGPVYTSAKGFGVVGADEYGLDADNDGIGCET